MSKKLDYWGYYSSLTAPGSLVPSVYVNPSATNYQQYLVAATSTVASPFIYTIGGFGREADPSVIADGTLNKIIYSQGATTTLSYEPNNYYDAASASTAIGSGIRVKQIIDSVNAGSSNNIIRSYSYIDAATGLSSGKPISLPAFAFAIPYSGTATGQSKYQQATAISAFDLSSEDHTIMYSYSKVIQTGAGSTVYQYFVPATYWDLQAGPDCGGCSTNEWTPTLNYMARGNCTPTYGVVRNDIYSYPFIPNVNYDFERGLPKLITSYNDAKKQVSQTTYTWQRSNNPLTSSTAPSVITGFKYDFNTGSSLTVCGYNKYNVLFNTSELTAMVTTRVDDTDTLGTTQVDTTIYTYGSSHHNLLTQVQKTNSDRTIVNTITTYTKDYPVAMPATDPNVNGLYYLQQNNINVPVETYQQVTNKGITKTTGASLTLFKAFTPVSGTTLYLPSQQLKMSYPDGNASFVPYTVTSTTQTRDIRYFGTTNFDTYDNTGYPIMVDDSNKHVQTTVIDHYTNRPTAVFNNAGYTEVAFNDFDTKGEAPFKTFTITGSGAFTPVGSHAGNAAGFTSTQTATSSTLTKNATAAYYVFSIWINSTVANGSLTLSGMTSPPSITYKAGSGWTYHEVKIPASSFSSPFNVSFTSDHSISIDDILFYPDAAEVATVTYDATNHSKIAETNTNGVSNYFQNDQWGRLLFQYDQDKNIVKKMLYITPDIIDQGLATPSIGYGPSPVFPSILTSFYAQNNPCITGTTYHWDFNDGTTATRFNDPHQSHTFGSIGTYNVTVTATNPLFSTKSASTTVTVVPPPLTPQICVSGVTLWDNCTNSAVEVDTCGSNPHDSHNSYFTITSVGGSGYGTLSYQWQISYDSGATWSNTGTNATQMSIFCTRESRAYRIRCVVTSTASQSGTSNTQSFYLQPC